MKEILSDQTPIKISDIAPIIDSLLARSRAQFNEMCDQQDEMRTFCFLGEITAYEHILKFVLPLFSQPLQKNGNRAGGHAPKPAPPSETLSERQELLIKMDLTHSDNLMRTLILAIIGQAKVRAAESKLSAAQNDWKSSSSALNELCISYADENWRKHLTSFAHTALDHASSAGMPGQTSKNYSNPGQRHQPHQNG